MKIVASSVQEYLEKVPEDRKEVFMKIYNTVRENVPKGFSEELNYGMIGWVVPHEVYPNGYHCDPKLPLPFMSLANQKNFIALYHMGIYANPDLLDWFVAEYAARCKYKLDMGKSCVRFKRMNDVPYDLIEELVQKMSAKDWIALYEKNVKG